MTDKKSSLPLPVGATLIKRLHPNAKLPQYATDGACAFDLFPLLNESASKSIEPQQLTLGAGQMLKIRTGWAMKAPKDWCIELHSRSSQGKARVSLANRTGLIDSDYTGEILVLLVNEGTEPFTLREDQAFAQGKLAYAPKTEFFQVLVMPETDRGAGGFGSTNAKN